LATFGITGRAAGNENVLTIRSYGGSDTIVQ